MKVALLRTWFIQEKRDFPWRKTNDPYAIWVSEVMLQQTRASVVVPYYLRWMTLFPDVYALGKSSLDKVIKAWEGLGYYSRARNLHEGAKYIVQHCQGVFPTSESDLAKIKGLGPYTISALQSFAFHQKKAAVDGNVLRVLTRFFAIEEDITKGKVVAKLRSFADTLLPEQEPWVVSEALIELGATVCQKKARCGDCPLQKDCKGYALGMVEKLPVKSKKVKIESLYRYVAIIKSGSHFLLKRGEKGAIMSDLYEFPYFERDKIEEVDVEEVEQKIENFLSLSVSVNTILKKESQAFTRYRVTLFPILVTCKETVKVNGFDWYTLEAFKDLPFSSGHRRIAEQLFCSDLPI